MDEVHVGSLGLQQIGRPVPAIVSLECHLGILACVGHRERQLERVVDHAHGLEHLAMSVILTITERRRCRSIPTYCLWCSTGVSLRFRVALETPSVPCTFGSWRREELRRFAGA